MSRKNAIYALSAAVGVVLTILIIALVVTMPPKPGSYGDDNVETVVVLDGVWVSPESNGTQFKALVKNGTIEINLESADTTALYWKGTFPWNAGDENVISVADTEALEGSILGSQDKDKLFTYNGDNISFKFGALGVTTVIKMKKA